MKNVIKSQLILNRFFSYLNSLEFSSHISLINSKWFFKTFKEREEFFILSEIKIRLVCLTSHLRCWQKSYCGTSIATKGCGGPASPLFFPVFAGSFSYFTYKEVSDLEKMIFSTLISFDVFLKNILSRIVILFLTPLKFKVEQGSNFRKVNIPKCYSMLSHTDTL